MEESIFGLRLEKMVEAEQTFFRNHFSKKVGGERKHRD